MSDQFQNLNLEIVKADAADTFSATLKDDSGKTLAADSFKYKIDRHILSTIEDNVFKDAVKGANLIRSFGRELFKTVFSGQIAGYYKAAIDSRKDIRLRLLFKADEPELQRIPWEFLYDGTNFLAAYPRIQLTRGIIGISGDHHEKISGKIKVLAIVSCPLDLKDHQRLQAEDERLKIMQALDRANAAQQVDVEFLDEASLRNIQSKLDEDQYHIIHYTGHGSYSDKEDRGYLILENDQGKSEPVDNKTIATLFAGHKSLRLVVLSGCQTAKTSGRQAFSDLATPLLQQNIPAIVALQYSITDDSGIELATKLYTEIANRAPVDVALTRARKELLVGGGNRAVEFATPVLYTTNPDCLETLVEQPKATGIGFKSDKEIKLTTNVSLGIERLGNRFVGRRRQLRRIKDDFLQRGIRVVVVHGIGGIGKTVIASQAAERLLEHFDGIYAFDCRSGLTPEKILLELHEFLKRNGVDALDQVVHASIPIETKIDYLGQVLNQKRLLIIIDNFESMLPEEHDRAEIDTPDLKAALKTIINHCTDGSRFLFTSRYTFNLTDGRMTNLIDEINLGELSRPEAIMILNRIPDIAATDWLTKLEIFEKIGGHPYTINMFGLHAHQTSVKDVLDDLSIVTKEMVEFTLLDRSYERLTPEAKDLLLALSVLKKAINFSGVLHLAKQDGKPVEAEKLITELIHWGLLIKLEDDKDKALYQVHTLVKQFVKSQISDSEWKHRQITAAQYYENLITSSHSLWHYLDARDLYFDAGEFDQAGNIVANVTEYLHRWGLIEYAMRLNEQTTKTASHVAQTIARHHLGVIYAGLGHYDRALKTHEENLKIARGLGDKLIIAASLHHVGNIYFLRGDNDRALEMYEESLEIARELGDRSGLAYSLHQVGMIYQIRGDHNRALEQYAENLKILRELGDKPGIAASLHQVGNVHFQCGDYDRALQQYAESMKIFRDLGDKSGIARSLGQAGNVYRRRGENDRALEYYEECLRIFRDLGDKSGIATSQHLVGGVYFERGDFDRALEQYEESLKVRREVGESEGIARSLGQIGRIHEVRKDYRTALSRYIQSASILQRLQSPDAEKVMVWIADLREKMGEKEFEKLYNEVTAELKQGGVNE